MTSMSRIENATSGEPLRIDPITLRSVLGRFATGVTVITTLAPDGTRAGVTASSFNTLSLDPPLILWSLGLTAPSLSAFRAADRFAVNILRDDQSDLARQFGRPSADKFAGIETVPGLGGVPLIPQALAQIECAVWRRDEGGDHELYVGRVLRTATAEGSPLIFARGAFGQFGAHA